MIKRAGFPDITTIGLCAACIQPVGHGWLSESFSPATRKDHQK